MGASMTGALEEAIRFTLPWTAAVAIVLPDDAEVPDLDGRKVFRIPAASAETLEQIESLRAEGYEYLIVPAAAREWLKPDLRARLEERHRLVIDEAAAGALFALHGPPLAGNGSVPHVPSPMFPSAASPLSSTVKVAAKSAGPTRRRNTPRASRRNTRMR